MNFSRVPKNTNEKKANFWRFSELAHTHLHIFDFRLHCKTIFGGGMERRRKSDFIFFCLMKIPSTLIY